MTQHAKILAPKEFPAFRTCPVGFLVHSDNKLDLSRGCGYRVCHQSSCEYVRRLKESEQCD